MRPRTALSFTCFLVCVSSRGTQLANGFVLANIILYCNKRHQLRQVYEIDLQPKFFLQDSYESDSGQRIPRRHRIHAGARNLFRSQFRKYGRKTAGQTSLHLIHSLPPPRGGITTETSPKRRLLKAACQRSKGSPAIR